MQQWESTYIPRLSCQSNNVHSEENGEFALLQGSHGGSAIQIQVMHANDGLCYAQHDNESLEYDNNQERESVPDNNACQKMNSLVPSHERNMITVFPKKPLVEKKEVFLLESAGYLKQVAAKSGDGEAHKSSQPSTSSQPAMPDCDSFYMYGETRSNKKSDRGLFVVGVCVLVLSLLMCHLSSMHKPPIVHPQNHENITGQGFESQECFKECFKETKKSVDKAAEGNMTPFCHPNEEPDILHVHSQCPTEDPSKQQCLAKEYDDPSWASFKFGEADESMCSVDGGVYYGPEAPFRDPAPRYEIPKYKERMNSSFFGSIHSLPMDKISLSVPQLKRKRKKKSQARSKQCTSTCTNTAELSKSEPVSQMDSRGTRVSVVLFQLLLLQCAVLPASVPLQERLLLSDKANRPSSQTGLANYATFTNYQELETLTIFHVIITAAILLLNAFRRYIITVWPDVHCWIVDSFKKIRCTLSNCPYEILIFLYGRLSALFKKFLMYCWKLAKRAAKKIFEKFKVHVHIRPLLTVSLLLSPPKLMVRYIREKFNLFRRRMLDQPAKYVATQSCNEPQQSKPLPADFLPQHLISECYEQLICGEQAKNHPPATATSTDQHQITNSSPRVTGNFANSAQLMHPAEEASQVEIAGDFSEHIASCNHVYPSATDDDGGSPPYREHTDTVEPPLLHDSTSLQHGHSGTENGTSQYSVTSTGIHLEVKPCEPITCSDSSSNGELVCPTFFRRSSRDMTAFQNGEFVNPFQSAVLNNHNNITTHENFAELTAIVPQDVTATIPMDSPYKSFLFNTAVNYDLKTLQCVQMGKESLLPPERRPVNIDCNIMHESLGHDATLYTLILSEADRESIQLQDTPYLVCICRQ